MDPATPTPRRAELASGLLISAAAGALLLSFLSFQENRKLAREIAELHLKSSRIREGHAAIEGDRKTYERALKIVSSKETHRLTLKPASPELPAVQVFWNDSLGILVSARKLPARTPGRLLQLWVVPTSDHRPSRQRNPLSIEADSLFVVLDARLPWDEVAELIITEEPEHGSDQPSSASLWRVKIR